MSLCLSGGRAYGGVDLEIIKPPSPTTSSTRTTSSPSSTLSESSNSRLAICTRKPRTARKRPNQTYNEAAALLSTAYPAIFSTKHLPNKPQKFTKQPHESLFDQSSELLLPFPVIDSPGFLLHGKQIPSFRTDPKPHEAEAETDSSQAPQYEEDFDTESILDEEIEEGIIDSIMGISTDKAAEGAAEMYCNPVGLGRFDFGFGIRRGVRPMRNADDGNWRFSATVDVLQISPRLKKPSPPPPTTVDKKKKITNQPLHLKLNYEEVVKAWSGRPLPLPEDLAAETHVSTRLAQIDLFTESGGLREASVMRYKEKRRTRLFSKKIRYQVRKVNADRRPRMKGRFVRRSNSNAITRDEKSQTRKGRQGAGFGFGL